jgi:Icc protein
MWNKNLVRFLLLIFLLTGCENAFEYHPNEIRLDESERNLTTKYLNALGTEDDNDTIRFILMGDTQRFYDHILDFCASARQQQQIDFMLHCGDISDFGMAQEFKWVHGLLKQLPYPYLTVVGNHDLLANGTKVYEQMYGALNYHFDYAGVRFIMVNTNSREYKYNGNVPDIGWLKSALLPESVERAVVVSHIPPFDSDFDPELEQAYVKTLEDSEKVRLSLHGHQHTSYVKQPYGDKVSYVVTNSMKGRNYYVVEIWKEGFDVQEITY